MSLRRLLQISALVLVVATMGWGVMQLLPPRGVVPAPNPWRPAAGRRPLVIAHAGGQGLRPANTLSAFEHSAALGCDLLEADLRLTKEGVLVTVHDATIDRTSDGRGRVIDFTVAELKQRNFGFKFKDPAGAQPFRSDPARLATLEELFARFPALPFVLELKDREVDGVRAAAALAALITRFRREAMVIVASFDDATIAEFRRASGGRVATAGAREETKRFVLCNKAWLDWCAPGGLHALQIPVASAGFHLDTPRLIRAAHRRNLAVHYWTINDPAEMRRLLALGADGIMTDRPDVLTGILADLGFR